jgi:hypothetical protein
MRGGENFKRSKSQFQKNFKFHAPKIAAAGQTSAFQPVQGRFKLTSPVVMLCIARKPGLFRTRDTSFESAALRMAGRGCR